MNPTSNSVAATLPVQAASAPRTRDDAPDKAGFQHLLSREMNQNQARSNPADNSSSAADSAAPNEASSAADNAAPSDAASAATPPVADAAKAADAKKPGSDKADGSSDKASAADPGTAQSAQANALLALGLPLPLAAAASGSGNAIAPRGARGTPTATAVAAAVAATPAAATAAVNTGARVAAAPALPGAAAGKPGASSAAAKTAAAASAATPNADVSAKPAVATPPAIDALAGQLAATREADPLKTDAASPAFNALSAAAAMQPAQFDKIAAAATPQLAPPVGNSAWDQALGERIVWMAGAQQQSATLTLNPPNLGPLRIDLDLSNNQVNANFVAMQPEVRHALESALPRLREMLGDAGMQLGQATVSADLPRHGEQGERQARWQPQPDPTAPAAALPLAAAGLTLPRAGRGLVDTFA